MEKQLTEAMDEITLAMKEDFEKRQLADDQYVVAYYDKQENLIGYHADTFCHTTDNKLGAKRYNGDNPYSQLATIKKNLDHVLSVTEETKEDGLFGSTNWRTKTEDFKGLSGDQIDMYAEYLDKDAPLQRFKFKIM